MRALLVILCLVAPILTGCTAPYTYMSYEIVRQIAQLKAGDEVKIVLKEGETIRGTVVQVDEPFVNVATYDTGKRRLEWDSIRVLERIRRTQVTVQ